MWSLEARSGDARARLALAFILSLALPLGGCASTSPSGAKAPEGGAWDRTLRGISSVLETTKTAVTTTVRRIVREQREGWEEMREKEKREQEAVFGPPKPAPPALRQAQPAPTDRFPAGRLASREQDLGRSERPPARSQASPGLLLFPRIPQTPEQIRARMAEIDTTLSQERDPDRRRSLTAERERLASALQPSIEEESLIREMEQLRGRLRRLQNRLNDIQRARP
jgi:hypothetical protein